MAQTEIPEFDPSSYWKEQQLQTSTSAWLLDTARAHPSHTYTGFDITPSHFPHAHWLPPNLSLKTWDLFTPVPKECVGVFDIVHVRAFTSCILANRVEPVVEKLKALLKPGGWLQWDESDTATLSAEVPEGAGEGEGQATKRLVALQHMFSAQNRVSSDWLRGLASTLAAPAHGFSVLADERFPPRPELARAWSDNQLTVWLGLGEMLPEGVIELPRGMGLPEGVSRALWEGWVRQAVGESGRGVRLGMEMSVAVGRLGE